MGLSHGAVTDGGLGITGCLIHEKREVTEDVSIESMGSDGAFADGQGKSLRKKVSISVSGERLSTAALPAAGIGKGISAADVHIDRTEIKDANEGAGEFTVEGHYHAAGAGDWATDT
jgi:hypothetical protein